MPRSPEPAATTRRRQAARDARIVSAINAFWADEGVAPTAREVLVYAGLTSKAGLQSSLTRLREAGTVTWVPGKARTLRVVDE